MRSAVRMLAVMSVAVSTAHAKNSAPWEFRRDRDSCAIHHEVEGADGSLARVSLSWRDDGGASASAHMHRSLPRGSRVASRFAGADAERQYAYGHQVSMFHIEGFAKARAQLLAGRAIELIVEARGKPASVYTTGVTGVEEAIAALDRCIDTARRTATPPAARWTATTTGTMGMQSCRLAVSGLTGVEGVGGYFDAVRGAGVRFAASSSPSYLADGGTLRVDLPGAKEPWVFDTESFGDTSRAPPADHPSRSATLLRELARGQPPRTVFTPRGGSPVPVSIPLENWKVAHAMFEACTSVSAGPKPARVVSYTELRHVVEERPDTCELTGTYQLHGNGIWLVLTTEGGNPALKVTHRTLGNGFKLMSMDLRAFGGSRNLAAPDATLPLDAARFTAVRQGLVGSGVEFGIAMSRTESHAAQFGGEPGRIEAAMFEACVKTRSIQ